MGDPKELTLAKLIEMPLSREHPEGCRLYLVQPFLLFRTPSGLNSSAFRCSFASAIKLSTRPMRSLASFCNSSFCAINFDVSSGSPSPPDCRSSLVKGRSTVSSPPSLQLTSRATSRIPRSMQKFTASETLESLRASSLPRTHPPFAFRKLLPSPLRMKTVTFQYGPASRRITTQANDYLRRDTSEYFTAVAERRTSQRDKISALDRRPRSVSPQFRRPSVESPGRFPNC